MRKIFKDSYLHKLILKWIHRLQTRKRRRLHHRIILAVFRIWPYLSKYVSKNSKTNCKSSRRHLCTIHVKEKNSKSDSKGVKNRSNSQFIAAASIFQPLAATCSHPILKIRYLKIYKLDWSAIFQSTTKFQDLQLSWRTFCHLKTGWLTN